MWTMVSAVHRVGIKWTWGSGFVGGHFSGEYTYINVVSYFEKWYLFYFIRPTSRFRSYRLVNTFRLSYKNQSVNAV